MVGDGVHCPALDVLLPGIGRIGFLALKYLVFRLWPITHSPFVILTRSPKVPAYTHHLTEVRICVYAGAVTLFALTSPSVAWLTTGRGRLVDWAEGCLARS